MAGVTYKPIFRGLQAEAQNCIVILQLARRLASAFDAAKAS
jgi:hypothetical protein